MTHQESLRKVQGCLKLAARAGTPEESAAAASAAQRIIDNYKLDVSAIDYDAQESERETEEIKDFRNDPLDIPAGGYSTRWGGLLASSLAKANQCKIVFGFKTKNGARPINIFGRPSDVQTVRYLYSYFKAEVIRISELFTKGNSSAYVNQFRHGVVDAIREHLTKSQQETFATKRSEVNGLALVKVDNALARIEKRSQEVEKFVQNLFGGTLRKGRGGNVRNYDNLAGRHFGQEKGREHVRFTSSKGGLTAGRKEIGS